MSGTLMPKNKPICRASQSQSSCCRFHSAALAFNTLPSAKWSANSCYKKGIIIFLSSSIFCSERKMEKYLCMVNKFVEDWVSMEGTCS